MGLWSLRTKLVAAIGVALVPMLVLAGWNSYDSLVAVRDGQARVVAAAIERVMARQHDLIESSRRLLTVVCGEDSVRKSADPAPAGSDVERCVAYLADLLQKFPREYSAALVTDENGVARCSSIPTIVGVSFADRTIFRAVRDKRAVSVGSSIASRITSRTVVPIGAPIEVDGHFRGMCSLGIPLKTFAELTEVTSPGDPVTVMLVDAAGTPVAGNPELSLNLPVPARLAASISGGQTIFADYGQNGSLQQFHVVPLQSGTLYAVAIVPAVEGIRAMWRTWRPFGLIVLAAAIVLIAGWLGADRWCVQPLRYIADYANRIARGEDAAFAPRAPRTRELVRVGEAVHELAGAVANRESALKAGLEQRDHMLREIHHRVKNNLQMISSLLNLQAGEIRSPRIRRFFGDAQNRVLTLSILHRHLYERSSWALVDFQQFISDLVRQISVGRQRGDHPMPRYHIRAPIMAVGPDTAIPVGLIVTEAVATALNHDFTAVAAPEIRIEASNGDGEQVELVIEDNGHRRRDGAIGADLQGGFGLTLIRGLALQLGGEATVEERQGGGIRVKIVFPMAKGELADA
jgi:two-component sensor histidine kinase